MPLVDYASSDEESDNECDGNEKEEKAEIEEKSVVETISKKESVIDDNPSLFSALPKPRTGFSFLGDDNKLSKLLLNKNQPLGQKSEKESIKISVPTVSEFEDNDDEPVAKKLKPSVKGVKLFSILPPPKNASAKETTNRTFVPHSVAKSQVKQTAKKEAITNNKTLKDASISEELDNEEDDTPVGSSFFGSGLTEPSVSTEPESTNNTNNMYEAVSAADNILPPENSYSWNQAMPEENANPGTTTEMLEESYNYPDAPQPQVAIPVESNPLELDEKALQILCGGKKKRQQMPMNIIDLSGEEIMPDSKEWLLKQLTEEKRTKSHSHRKHDGPSTQQRRKHQITYLAFQAKEQELELQNQWANNRMSRKQTQSKYGF